MGLRVVQRGEGDPRPLVLGFLVGGDIDKRLRGAFGPAACIIADGLAKGPSFAEVLAFARLVAGLQAVSGLALIGYSAGCQRVRAFRREGVLANAYLLADGTHASWPPEAWQIEWLRELADEARQGRILVVATHTLQTYTEQLPPPRTFSSTLRVLRMATGFPLAQAGPLDRPMLSADGALLVYSYASREIDAPAHAAQHSRVVPEMCERHLGPWLRGEGYSEQKHGGLGGALLGGALMLLALID